MSISLDDITSLARTLLTRKEEQSVAELALDKASARVKFIEDNLLPNALREVDLSSLTLSDGKIVSVEANISAAVTELAWPEAEKWLADKNMDGIIKNQVLIEFDKGQNDASDQFTDIVAVLVTRPKFFEFVYELVHNENADGNMVFDRADIMEDSLPSAAWKTKRSIHPQTLKAFVRECLRKGIDVPEDLFSLFITDHVKIANPK